MIKCMALSDIVIPVGFQAHPPMKHKMEICRDFFKEYLDLDRRLVVSPEGVLLDGYVGYLVLKENDVEAWSVYVHAAPEKRTYRDKETTYIAGVHGNQKREFWWRLCAKTTDANLAAPGYRAIVNTKYGMNCVTITKVVTLPHPPIEGVIKKAYHILPPRDMMKELIDHE